MTKWDKHRLRAYHKQDGRCFYCDCEMWERRIESKGDFKNRVNPSMSKKDLRYRLCTAEHLIRICEGGGAGSNIVAACQICNSSRGNTPHREWASIIRERR